ncbi:MAG: Zn-dependent exopeptidase M28 [Clostridia bacterium]|nr:Zn-dependent exopeptidase M28 [Clostridia bacterium]
MNAEKIMQIIRDTAYTRTGGSAEELACANYLKNIADEMGVPAYLEEFPVNMATVKDAHLYIDGEEVECKGYMCAASETVEAPLYYMPANDPYSLSQVKGKIVLLDGYLGHWTYRDIVERGAVGFITYDGNANYADCDIDRRELRAQVCEGVAKLPGVNINAKSAIKIVEAGAKTAKIVLEQEEYEGKSHNVVFDLPGEIDDTIVFTAHYDSTSLSQGSYDNMSGSVGLLAMAEHFKDAPHRYTLRFVLCGSEERGLLGSKAYVAAHEEELSKFALNINLDMIGSIMGKFISCCTCEEAAVGYIKYMGFELGFPVSAYQGVYSSDSTPFADKGVPAISFARSAPGNTATIHNSYDTPALLSGEQMVADIAFIQAFATRMANAVHLPIDKKMPDNMKEKLDKYLVRKR